jgi:hypothetical protein
MQSGSLLEQRGIIEKRKLSRYGRPPAMLDRPLKLLVNADDELVPYLARNDRRSHRMTRGSDPGVIVFRQRLSHCA